VGGGGSEGNKKKKKHGPNLPGKLQERQGRRSSRFGNILIHGSGDKEPMKNLYSSLTTEKSGEGQAYADSPKPQTSLISLFNSAKHQCCLLERMENIGREGFRAFR